MNEADVITVIREGLWTGLVVGGPSLAAALLSGLLIAFFQALTQIQEITLTFVPKIFAIFFAVLISLPFMYQAMARYAELLVDMMIRGY
ncbi:MULTISPECIES: flagellar biosynthetic protein FliQ [Iodidimonas]|jgi:flagellar biosynthetic protein FliQ|uniref:Flagellar biosynthesis protein FliQ n=1 Tax=Iodidimonas nitroreducens TaxID=1236968 RepID=A0A5A7N6I4_9PROT|nr:MULTISPECIES: flagellar biosynthetic protein FliQ [Iodidimonas]GAK32325.1 flagellar biosynthetic protein FliQ [alpha proteobacterium Q-1]GER03334.1 flagellar biosynthesis protein FliQ [Iodidimonas nitroreducens]